MLRSASRLFLMGILLMLTLVGTAAAAPASQSGAFLPAVVAFSSDSAAVSYADVEAGQAQVTLSWQTINTNGQYRIALEAYYRSGWISLAAANQTLPLNGSRTVSVPLPENYGPPTFRLTLKTSAGEVVEQRFLTLSYTVDDTLTPSIASFTSLTKTVDTNLLVQGTARVNVQWIVANRRPDTLIRLDQVLADDSVVAAEGPRRALWLPAQGQGTLIPRSTSSRADLRFRLSLVSLNDGTVYDEAELTLPIVGQILVAVPQTGSQPVTTAAQTGPINTFAAQPQSGGGVVVEWDASGAQDVQLLQTVGDDGPKTLYIELPPAGSMVVPEEAAGATFELRAQSADGSVATGEVTVTSTDQGGGQ